MTKYIELNNGDVASVSDEDYDYLVQFGWTASGTTGVYARATINGVGCNMHYLVLERIGLKIPDNMEVDHEDRNRLNNQRDNLRIVSKSVNGYNADLRRNNTSGRKGVSFHTVKQKWSASIRVRGILQHLGYFTKFEDAVKAREEAEKRLC